LEKTLLFKSGITVCMHKEIIVSRSGMIHNRLRLDEIIISALSYLLAYQFFYENLTTFHYTVTSEKQNCSRISFQKYSTSVFKSSLHEINESI